jgi:translation initiation factor IF-3
MAHQEIGHELIQKVIAALADVALVESPPRSEGRTLNAVLMPKPSRTGGGKTETLAAPAGRPESAAAAATPPPGASKE